MPRIRAGSIAEHKELTRREILAAASALFRNQGYAETSLGDIAAYVGIGRTTLYEYFTDKADLLATLVEETIPEVIGEIVADADGAGTARERLGELVVRGLEFVSDEGHLGALVMQELPRLGGDAGRRVWEAHDRLGAAVDDLVAEGIASGEFRPFDAAIAGRIVTSLLMTASQTLIRSHDAKQRRHDIADTLVRFVFEGLAAD